MIQFPLVGKLPPEPEPPVVLARSEYQKLIEDQRRLDWLSSHHSDWSWDYMRRGGELTIDNREGLDCIVAHQPTLREAIDEARRREFK